ncbi:MAG: NAD-dependent epimerase/dehydratase family protein [Flavobacteriia bacterium]|nr:NAD-dependent epimerase/dehydratase family protein [Flavobacteriia bacterium]
MKAVLVFGGTNFIGRVLVERLLQEQDIEVTLFNRGKTNPHLFPGVRKIYGDRDKAVPDGIADQHWDFIIDLSCYFPQSLSNILSQIQLLPSRYIFISTCSVYDNDQLQCTLRSEDAPILDCTESQAGDQSPSSYGQRKAECERILKNSGIPFCILRPALVYGRYDPTDRLYYWLHQVQNEEALLLPDHGEKVFSATYVGDLVNVILLSLKQETESQVFNVTTVPTLSISQLVTTAAKILRKSTKSLNISSTLLKSEGIAEWKDIPLWLNSDFFTYDNSKVKSHLGFSPTAFSESIQETISYYEENEWPPPNYGITKERKEDLLKLVNP